MELRLIEDFTAIHARQVCYLSGRAGPDSEGVITTGVPIEGEGELAFCVEAVREMGLLAGLIAPEQLDELRLASAEHDMDMQVTIARLQDELERLQAYQPVVDRMERLAGQLVDVVDRSDDD